MMVQSNAWQRSWLLIWKKRWIVTSLIICPYKHRAKVAPKNVLESTQLFIAKLHFIIHDINFQYRGTYFSFLSATSGYSLSIWNAILLTNIVVLFTHVIRPFRNEKKTLWRHVREPNEPSLKPWILSTPLWARSSFSFILVKTFTSITDYSLGILSSIWKAFL